jgi:hypothetical protein
VQTMLTVLTQISEDRQGLKPGSPMSALNVALFRLFANRWRLALPPARPPAALFAVSPEIKLPSIDGITGPMLDALTTAGSPLLGLDNFLGQAVL